MVLVYVLIGYAAAQSRPGLSAYQSGDFAAAIKELRPLAEQGDIGSQWLLGSSYANAKPPIQDLTEAERWTRRAAEQGHVGAMVDMAKINLFYKPDKDEKTAVLWYQKAAEYGHPEAQFMIGSYCFSGKGGINKDYITAYMWWILSGAKGHPLAKLMLERSKDRISQEQIDEAKQRAREWRPIKP